MKSMTWMLGGCLLAAVCSAGAQAGAKDPVDWVNTEIGTISHMLVPVFPTVGLPNGMLRFYPPNHDFTTHRIDGMGLTVPSHRSGKVFNLLPYSGTEEGLAKRWTSTYDQMDAKPYRFSIFLDTHDTLVELAPARKSAVVQLTFEAAAPVHAVKLAPIGKGELTVRDRSVTGWDEFKGGRVYLAAEFSKTPQRAGVVNGGRIDYAASKSTHGAHPLVLTFGRDAGEKVFVRFGISFISEDQAAKNLQADVKDFVQEALARAATDGTSVSSLMMSEKDFGLETLASAARAEWNRVLGQVRVQGGTDNEKAVFYTALYRCYERMIDFTEDGRYFSGMDRKVHDAKGVPYWCDDWIWDTYRAKHPLMALLRPHEQAECLSSYIRMYEDGGFLPTFPEINGDAHCMNGLHTISIFLDAWRKGIRNFDLEKAYEACKYTLFERSLIPWYRGPKTELDDYLWNHGYFPALHSGEKETVKEVSGWERRQTIAVTLAAAYDVWCLGEIAAELGKTADAARFRKLAQNYKTVWNEKTHFFHPKDKDGKWIEPFDYKYAGGQGARDYYDENNAWTYIWDVQHDLAGLISCFGGREAFLNKLDQLFCEGYSRPRWEFYNILPDSTGNVGMFVMGNEPSFHIPYLYNYAGRPWETQKRVRMLMDAWFRNDRMGICGDEDGGGMSAFAVFSAMGFYPVTPGSPTYTFGSPIFREVAIDLQNGKRFTLRAPEATRNAKYIQSVRINGQPCENTWFSHAVIAQGGNIEIRMGDRPNRQWGTAPENAPFSMSSK